MKRKVFDNRIYPRWLILIIDQLIVIAALLISVWIQQRVNFTAVFIDKIVICLLLYNVIAAGVFVLMKIHEGIIRYSSVVDVSRVFSAVLLVGLLSEIFIGLLLAPYLQIEHRWLLSVLLINFFISGTALVLMRVTVKLIYHYLEGLEMVNRESLLIYGADSLALLMKHGLEASREHNYRLCGFIDDNPDRKNKQLEGKRVYGSSAIEELKARFGIEKMIVMEFCPDMEGRKRAIECCLEYGIRVISVPASSHWLNGKLTLSQLPDLKIEDLLQREPIRLDQETIGKSLQGKRVLITGAAGSIGSEIVRQVLSFSPSVVVLCDQAETPLHDMQMEIDERFPEAKCEYYIVSLHHQMRLEAIFSSWLPQVVFHAAALKHVPMMERNPGEAIRTNVLGTKYLADLAVQHHVDNFIMISTDKAVNPTNVMGASKRIAEIYIQSLHTLHTERGGGTKFITTRFGNVLGSNGSVVPRFSTQIKQGGPVTVTHPEVTRYFMTIAEAVQLVIEASVMGKGGEIFIFDMGKPVKILELAVNMIKLAGYLPYSDIPITFTGLRPGEKLYEELLNDSELVLPTYHEKIKIANVMFYSHIYIYRYIDQLVTLIDQGGNATLIKKIQEILPEYQSDSNLIEDISNVGS